MPSIRLLPLQSSTLAPLRSISNQIRNHEPRIANMVIARELVPVERGQLDLERALVCAHLEEELLVPGGV